MNKYDIARRLAVINVDVKRIERRMAFASNSEFDMLCALQDLYEEERDNLLKLQVKEKLSAMECPTPITMKSISRRFIVTRNGSGWQECAVTWEVSKVS